MPVVAIAEVACLRGEVKTVDFLVTGLVGLGLHFVEQLLGNLQFLAVEHRTAEEHNLCLRVMRAHQLQQFLVALLEQIHIVVVCRKVVGAQVDADHIGLVTAEVPFLAEE